MPGMIKADRFSSSIRPANPSQNLQQGSEERGLRLIHLLFSCANAVAAQNLDQSNFLLDQLAGLACMTGDPMQRVATYFMEALAARITKTWPGIYKALQSTALPAVAANLAARQAFFDVVPFLKLAFLTTNQVLLDSMESEKVVHFIDLEACNTVQWMAMLQALKNRKGGPPHLRISAVSDRSDLLNQMGLRLSESAEKLDIPFQFHPVKIKLQNLQFDMLNVKSGEAVGISSVLQLHSLLRDEKNGASSPSSSSGGFELMGRPQSLSPSRNGFNPSDRNRSNGFFDRIDPSGKNGDVIQIEEEKYGFKASESSLFRACSNGFSDPIKRSGDLFQIDEGQAKKAIHRAFFASIRQNGLCEEGSAVRRGPNATERILAILHSLKPKAFVLVEQESNHNGSTMPERFVEALHYYSAMFDCLDSSLPINSLERVSIEKHIFGEEIKNIVASEGPERIERHEKLEKWRRRLLGAGFFPLFLGNCTVIQAERLLAACAADGYGIVEQGGSLTVCWQGRAMFSVSAWHTRSP